MPAKDASVDTGGKELSTHLSKKTVEELVGSKDKLTEFTTATLIHSITIGLRRIKSPNTSPTAVNQFVETLRKVRADLTGDDHEGANVPQMMVNIQFNGADKSHPPAVDVSAQAKPAKPLNKQDKQLLETTDAADELKHSAADTADLFSVD